MSLLVVDTSIIVKWYLADEREPFTTEAKDLLRAHLEGKRRIIVPALACYELGNVLKTQADLSHPVLIAYIHDFYALSLEILPLDEPFAVDTMKTALRHDITFYDATFIALAGQLGCPFFTADNRLLKKTRTLPFVRSLKEWRG